MLAKQLRDFDTAETERRGANANWLTAGDGATARIGETDTQSRESVSMSIYQLIAGSLEGPMGLHPETFLAAAGAGSDTMTKIT